MEFADPSLPLHHPSHSAILPSSYFLAESGEESQHTAVEVEEEGEGVGAQALVLLKPPTELQEAQQAQGTGQAELPSSSEIHEHEAEMGEDTTPPNVLGTAPPRA